MRSFLLAVAVLALILPHGATAAIDCRSDEVLAKYISDHCREMPASPFYLLAYDHERKSGWWSGALWSCTDPCGTCSKERSLLDDELELQPNGSPRLTVPAGSRVATFVIGTNPLAYTVTAKASSEAPHEDLADLKQLTALLGGNVASLLALTGTTAETATQAGDRTLSAQADVAGLMAAVSPESRAFLATETDIPGVAFAAWTRPVFAAIRVASDELRTAVGALNAAVGPLQATLNSSAEMERLLRAVETRAVDELNDPNVHKLPPARPSEGAVHAAFEGLATARKALDGARPICRADLATLQRLIELRLQDDVAFAGEYKRLVDALAGGKPCTELEGALRNGAAWFAANPLGRALPPIERAILEGLGVVIKGYRLALDERDAKLKQAQDLLDKRTDAGKRASYLAVVHDRLAGIGIPPAHSKDWICGVTHGVLRVPRGEGDVVEVPWNRVRSESFTINFDSNQSAFVAPLRASGQIEEYQLARSSPWRSFDVDLGLTHSPIVESTFAAVSVASLGSKAPPEQTDAKTLVVARTVEERRSGVVALFGSWFPGRSKERAVALGWQLGLGLDTKQPAVFLGPTLSFGRFFNLSGGLTGQEVEDLVDELPVGHVVNATTDVRTKKELEWDWYVGLTLTLDDLPFFSSGK